MTIGPFQSTIGVQPAPDLTQPLLTLMSNGQVATNSQTSQGGPSLLQQDVSATLADTAPDNQVPAIVNFSG